MVNGKGPMNWDYAEPAGAALDGIVCSAIL